jgi:hypothetical protein
MAHLIDVPSFKYTAQVARAITRERSRRKQQSFGAQHRRATRTPSVPVHIVVAPQVEGGFAIVARDANGRVVADYRRSARGASARAEKLATLLRG